MWVMIQLVGMGCCYPLELVEPVGSLICVHQPLGTPSRTRSTWPTGCVSFWTFECLGFLEVDKNGFSRSIVGADSSLITVLENIWRYWHLTGSKIVSLLIEYQWRIHSIRANDKIFVATENHASIRSEHENQSPFPVPIVLHASTK